jgi:diguanylate cyclase (GGDEF)-like protein
VAAFATMARQSLEHHRQGRDLPAGAVSRTAAAAADLLPRLDAAVGLHETAASAHLRGMGQVLGVLLAVTLLTLGGIWAFVFLPVEQQLRREHRRLIRAEAMQADEGDRQRLVHRLNNALEMCDREEDVLATVVRAVDHLGPPLPLTLLLADASNAHLRIGATHPQAGPAACAVEMPWQCTAIRRGRTSYFASSTDLDTCPKLREGESCGALCTPVSFMGETLGVLHTRLEAGQPATPAWMERQEHLAGATAARLSGLRAFSKVQLQATTDPLTGLLNRRALEEEVRSLASSGKPFALAMADLDHFKRLNDTHGHDAGDRALTTFAKVCTDTLRDGDRVARFGGEEFVLVFRDAEADAAARVLERLRRRLAEVVAGGDTPTFTASFGVADSRVGSDLAVLTQIADAALLRAKEEGRDRVLVADMGEHGRQTRPPALTRAERAA